MWAIIFTALGLLTSSHFYLDSLARGYHSHFAVRLVEELTGTWSGGLLVLLLVPWLRRMRSSAWPRRYAGHLAALLAFSLLHTSLIWSSRSVLFPLLGLGPYDYGDMPWRYAMEFFSDVIVYVLAVYITWLLDHYHANRARELRAAQLESALAEARLEALRLQLNPHFLFNALNAVSASMYEQPRAADEMLARIGDLLRATLSAQAQEHRLADELRLLELYLDIQRARYGERLQVQLAIAPGLDAAPVPFLVLQPLVENAIEHAGGSARREVDIAAVAEHGSLVLHVRDRGAGPGHDPHRGHGIGLGNVQARLRHLYADAAGLALEPADGGGTRVRLWLPLRGGATA